MTGNKDKKNNNRCEKDKEDLKDLENYIQEFFKFLPLPICAANPFGVIINVNNAFCKLTGYNETEIVGERVKSLFLDDEKFGLLEEKVLNGKIIHNKEIALSPKNKENIPVQISISTRKDRKKMLVGYFLALSDIRNLKKIQKKLEKQIEVFEKLQEITVDREIKMARYKNKIKELTENFDQVEKNKTNK